MHRGAFMDIANNDRRAVMVGLHAEHKAKKRGELVGGGLTDALAHIGLNDMGRGAAAIPPYNRSMERHPTSRTRFSTGARFLRATRWMKARDRITWATLYEIAT